MSFNHSHKIVFTIIVSSIVLVSASGGSSSGSSYGASSPSSSSYSGSSSSSYGSMPAPLCPKNYVFSCQPSLSPAPCSQPSGGYGSQGAYSENVPYYVAPVVYPGPSVYAPEYRAYQGYQGYQGNYQGAYQY